MSIMSIMSITLTLEGRRAYITGNTYPHKDAIRAIGAKWDGKIGSSSYYSSGAFDALDM